MRMQEESAMIRVTMDEAKERLPDLMDAAARGATVLIEKEAGQSAQVVQLVAVVTDKPKPQFGSARGLIKTADDFNAPLEDFREYEYMK